MRGSGGRAGALFSYVDLEARAPAEHPLRAIRVIVNEVLGELSAVLAKIYVPVGRPSIPPEQLLRALLLQAFYSIRSERRLMERLDFDLLFRWFVGLDIDDPVWDHPARVYRAGESCSEAPVSTTRSARTPAPASRRGSSPCSWSTPATGR